MRSEASLHHVGVPPVRVFFGQRGQDPRACRDRAAHVSTHVLFIIITAPITVITPQQRREASPPPPQQQAPGNPRPRLLYDGVLLQQTPSARWDASHPFNQRPGGLLSEFCERMSHEGEPRLTCFGLGPIGRAHQPPRGLVAAVTVLLVEAVPPSCTQ